ncbi:hypothetical protein [Paraferrimonas sedimenticola]|uniref:DUF2116 family Zn-ribbon domain-containing protein n=1 Tax=Paraferrimonas sedimenticola TaxID=375674 RepID=A0AA37RVI0_9GAMM|nr:hypothetical protein [Paraferrimonas sedimenticola]GLP95317.1 hypothetical protein GCM10007895_06230 [Paraferrimonas sedimenticola]
MADVIDQANELQEMRIAHQIENRNNERLINTGRCHYCDSLTGDRCFCDVDCRDDFEFINRAR